MPIMPSLAHIAHQGILMVGFALSPYPTRILTLTTLGPLMMDCHQAMGTAVTGKDDRLRLMSTYSDYEAYSEIMLALRAPTTTKCDMCLVSFCGINVQGRCVAAQLPAQQPHGLTDIGDLIECPYIYDCFDSNTIEVEIMLDYLTAQRLTPKHIYREVSSDLYTRYTYLTATYRLLHISNPNPGVSGHS